MVYINRSVLMSVLADRHTFIIPLLHLDSGINELTVAAMTKDGISVGIEEFFMDLL